MEFAKTIHHCPQLLLVDGITLLCRREFLRTNGNDVVRSDSVLIVIRLIENTTNTNLRRIRSYRETFVEIRISQQRRLSDCTFEQLEVPFGDRSPFNDFLFLQWLQRTSDVGEMPNMIPKEHGKTNERGQFGTRGGTRPFEDGAFLVWIKMHTLSV